MKYKVGQSVFVVYNRRMSNAKPHRKTITKIGRRWIYLDDGDRFDSNEGFLDAGEYSSHGSVYTSEKEYIEFMEKNELFSQLKRKLGFRPPSDEITSDDIREVMRLLRINPTTLNNK